MNYAGCLLKLKMLAMRLIFTTALFVGLGGYVFADDDHPTDLADAIATKNCPALTHWLDRLSEASSGDLVELGKVIEQGVCAPPDPKRALSLYIQAHRRGASIIAFRIGDMHLAGVGTNRSVTLAQTWFRLGALSEGANFKLDELLAWARVTTGRTTLSNRLIEELKRVDAERIGSPEKQYRNYRELLALSESANTKARAIRGWLSISAINGYPPALFDLARRHQLGNGLETDFVLYREYMWQAARSGHTDAQFELGMRFLRGDGVPVRPRYAYIWLRRAQLGGRSVHDELRKAAEMLSSDQQDIAERDALDSKYNPPS